MRPPSTALPSCEVADDAGLRMAILCLGSTGLLRRSTTFALGTLVRVSFVSRSGAGPGAVLGDLCDLHATAALRRVRASSALCTVLLCSGTGSGTSTLEKAPTSTPSQNTLAGNGDLPPEVNRDRAVFRRASLLLSCAGADTDEFREGVGVTLDSFCSNGNGNGTGCIMGITSSSAAVSSSSNFWAPKTSFLKSKSENGEDCGDGAIELTKG
mmetsp:Transcript_59562/g.158456  ORF Transcript_59562/g.158456 Transcript_59562/m.158456 type:complete len:212 (+) Transcript_59562:1232-1867(+)